MTEGAEFPFCHSERSEESRFSRIGGSTSDFFGKVRKLSEVQPPTSSEAFKGSETIGGSTSDILRKSIYRLRKSIVGDLKDSISGLTKSLDFVSQEKRKSNFKI